MGYENDPHRDEDGEPLMDYDDGFQSDHGDDNNNDEQHHQHLDDNLEDEIEDTDWKSNGESTPVFNESDSKSKPRKRLIKKSTADELVENFPVDDDVEDDMAAFVGDDEFSGGGKRKKLSGDGGDGSKRKENKSSFSKFSEKPGMKLKGYSSSKRNGRSGGGGGDDAEVKEMWDTIAGGDSEDDKEGPRMLDDDNFIDDTGVDSADRYGSDHGGYSPSRAPQAEEGEEDDEVDNLFKVGKKKKKTEKSSAEIALLVERVVAELEVAAESDAELNKISEPAVNKLKKLPLLIDALSKKQLQLEFLDHGVLTLLKIWLEPLPDGSLPNINIRAAILKILSEFPIDLEQYDRSEQLKKSGLGKVIMFLSKSDEETTANRKLAKELVDKWSRPIFNKSTRFEDMRNYEDERTPIRRPSMKKPTNKASSMNSRDDDLDLAEYSQEPKSGSGKSFSRLHASRPEAMSLDFVVRPQSKIDPDEIRARAKQVVHDQRRLKMNKRLQQLKAPKKKQLQATKLSIEGRGMVKYL